MNEAIAVCLQSPHEAPVRKAAARGTVSTVPMCATEGRASFLAESPVGYGSQSSQIIIDVLSSFLKARS